MKKKEQFMSVWFGRTKEASICKRVVAKKQCTSSYKERWDAIARRKGFKGAFYFYYHRDQQLNVSELMQP